MRGTLAPLRKCDTRGNDRNYVGRGTVAKTGTAHRAEQR